MENVEKETMKILKGEKDLNYREILVIVTSDLIFGDDRIIRDVLDAADYEKLMYALRYFDKEYSEQLYATVQNKKVHIVTVNRKGEREILCAYDSLYSAETKRDMINDINPDFDAQITTKFLETDMDEYTG